MRQGFASSLLLPVNSDSKTLSRTRCELRGIARDLLDRSAVDENWLFIGREQYSDKRQRRGVVQRPVAVKREGATTGRAILRLSRSLQDQVLAPALMTELKRMIDEAK